MNNLKAIGTKIFILRGYRVILDRDIANLCVETRVLKQAVRRNIGRFHEDFMFEIRQNEVEILVSQFVIPSKQHLGGSLPYALIEIIQTLKKLIPVYSDKTRIGFK